MCQVILHVIRWYSADIKHKIWCYGSKLTISRMWPEIYNQNQTLLTSMVLNTLCKIDVHCYIWKEAHWSALLPEGGIVDQWSIVRSAMLLSTSVIISVACLVVVTPSTKEIRGLILENLSRGLLGILKTSLSPKDQQILCIPFSKSYKQIFNDSCIASNGSFTGYVQRGVYVH